MRSDVDPAPCGSSIRPGLVLVVIATLGAFLGHFVSPTASALVVAVVLGAIIGNSPLSTPKTSPGLAFASRTLLRAGVVLLGLRLSLRDVLDLGWLPFLVVCTTAMATFFGTQWLGKKLGLSRDLSLLVATGFSICGASAIAAVGGATDATEEETAAALGLVAVAGTAAIFLLPTLASPFGLSDASFGAWAGASIHDVGQVVAAASISEAALGTAIVVKLTRVALLAPIVLGVNISRRSATTSGQRPPLLPAFVVGFLALVLVRTTGLMPGNALATVKLFEGLFLAAGMVGLGSAVRLERLRTLGPMPLLLGLMSWVLVGGISLAGVLLTA